MEGYLAKNSDGSAVFSLAFPIVAIELFKIAPPRG
jgi:hypothetical protein